jgi:hypothetical protein
MAQRMALPANLQEIKAMDAQLSKKIPVLLRHQINIAFLSVM